MNRMTAIRAVQAHSEPTPAARRLAALASLDHDAQATLSAAAERRRNIARRRELLKEGAPVAEPLLILEGWAARVRYLEDGRRQIMSFLLPGDPIGLCRQPRPVAVSTVVALTEVAVCPAPPHGAFASLDEAYAVSRALEETHLLAQVMRLGRMTAEERLIDLFLELRERLGLCGLATPDGFALPLTQEMLADATGLTSVHVNRVLQQLRRQGDIGWSAGRLTLDDPAALARKLGRPAVRVTEG